MAVLIDATPAYVSLADGKFDTRFPYLKQRATASAMSICNGPNWSLASNPLYRRGSRNNGGPANVSTFLDVNNAVSPVTVGGALELSPATGITIRDPASNRALFDTATPIMHIVNKVEGSRFFATPNPQGQAVNINQSVVLASIDPAATHIIGSVRTAYNSTQASSLTGPNVNDWWAVNGSFVTYCEWGEVGFGQAAGQVVSDKANEVVAQCILEFSASGGQLLLTERVRILALFAGGQWNPVSGGAVSNYVRQPFTLHYKLRAVAFS